MRKRLKIFVALLLFLTVVFFILNFKIKLLLIDLIESNSDDRVEVSIGTLIIQPISSTIRLKDVSVLVKDSDSPGFKKITVNRIFLDVASLWDFISGGTLIIEKFDCVGGNLLIHASAGDNAKRQPFDLNSIIQRIQSDAIRYQIKDMAFRDITLTLSKDNNANTTVIKHIHARALDVYLSADSMLKKKPQIEFYLPRQLITMPNLLTIGFDSLFFSTTNNSIQVNMLELRSPISPTSNSYKINADMVRLANVNFESLYSTGSLVIDSVFFGTSTVTADWILVPSKKEKDVQQGIPALPPMEIGNIAFQELASDITIRSDSIKNIFQVEHATLSIDHFRHQPDSAEVIYSPSYTLLVTQYSTFLGDNSSMSFDTIQIQKHTLALMNFIFKTQAQEKPLLQSPRFELRNVEWYDLLLNKQLVAQEALVYSPTIQTTIKPSATKKVEPRDNFEFIVALSDFLQVALFTLTDATAFVNIAENSMNLTLRGYNAVIRANDLLTSSSINESMDAIMELSFRTLQVNDPDFTAEVRNFKFDARSSSIGTLQYQSKNNNTVSVYGIKLGTIRFSESNSVIWLHGLGWGMLTADITSLSKSESSEATRMTLPEIRLKTLLGGRVDVHYLQNELALSVVLNQLNVKELTLADGIDLNGIEIKGKAMSIDARPNRVRIGEFSITDQGATLNAIRWDMSNEQSLTVLLDKLSFEAKVPDFARENFNLSTLRLDKLKLSLLKQDSVQQLDVDLEGDLLATNLRYAERKFSAGTLSMDIGTSALQHEKYVKNETLATSPTTQVGAREIISALDTLMQSRYTVKGVHQRDRQKAYADTAMFTRKTIQLKSGAAGVNVKLTGMEAIIGDSSVSLETTIESIRLNDVRIATEKLAAQVTNGSLNNLFITSDHLKDPWKVLEDNQHTTGITKLKGRIEMKGNLIQFDSLEYDPTFRSGRVHQFEYRPLKEKQQFLDEHYYQTTYMDARIKSIAFTNLDIRRLLRDTTFHLSSINVYSPTLLLGRDKTNPLLTTAVKPLPTNAIQQVNVKFKIDSLSVTDGTISYTEKSGITGQEGTLTFNNLEALVRTVKNTDLQFNDSLRLRATVRFMDSVLVNLRMRESYYDTLGGFLLATNVSPFHTSILSKVLIPLASVDFTSGFVDTMSMRAVGREHLSIGSMKFLYHDLKVEFLDKDDATRYSLKNELMKFAANTFVIRTKNTNRIGVIYYERDRNRAVFQYWVKMIMSGVTTSVGAKSNKRQIKKYMKELDQKKLPRVEGRFDLW